ncbi:MAG TPA: DMT family transporter, partial [Candidatus Nanoarchaeia archaeon]|nr:DMT family transporter [Candidatus Nanoarchaeia archaeon]
MDRPNLKSNKAKAIAFTLAAGILWGTSFPIIKVGLNYADPYTFVFLRFLVAAIVMVGMMTITRKLVVPKKQRLLILFLGVINGIAYVMQYVGMNYTTAAKAALFVSLDVVWVAMLSTVILREKFGTQKTLGVVAALIGIVFLTTNLNAAALGGGQLFGDLILVATGFCWAVFMVYNKSVVSDGKSVLSTLTWVVLGTLLPMLPFAFSAGTQAISLPLVAWLAIIYTAVACWVIPFYLFMEGLKNISPSTSTILQLSQVVVAAIISSAFL